MALNIKAIEDRLRVERQRRASAPTRDLREIIDRGRDRRTLDERAPDTILGYDDHGLPS